MQKKAEYGDNNPVKITGSMKSKLEKFAEREKQIVEIMQQVQEITNKINQNNETKSQLETKANSEDKNEAKKANEELKKTSKELEDLNKQLEEANKKLADLQAAETKVMVNLSGVSINRDVEVEAPTAEVHLSAEPQIEAPVNEVAEVTPETNSLSAELNDFSFEMPEEEPIAEVEANVSENAEDKVEATPEPEIAGNTADEPIEQASENTVTGEAELPEVKVAEIEPKEPEMVENSEPKEEVTENSEMDKAEDVVESKPNLEPVTPDYNFETPIIPISDEEIDKTLAENDKDEETKEIDDDITTEDIEAIDSIIAGNDFAEEKENTDKQDDVFAQMPTLDEVPFENDNSIEEEPVTKEPVEILEDYIRYKNYQEWLFAFAASVFNKDSFTLEELKSLEHKENFLSETEFDNNKTVQISELTNEKDNLEQENDKLKAQLKTTEKFASNITVALDDTKNDLEELHGQYDTQIIKFNDVKDELSKTSNELEDTKKQLKETQDELSNAKDEMQEMQEKIEKIEDERDDYKGRFERALAMVKEATSLMQTPGASEEEKNETPLTKGKGMVA